MPDTKESEDTKRNAKPKIAALAAGSGATLAGVAGGIAVAARDTRKRILGIPLGRRSRIRRLAAGAVERAQQPARMVGSRLSRS